MRFPPRRWRLLVLPAPFLAFVLLSSAAHALDARAAHLLARGAAYGDARFSSATNLVLDPAGMPDIPAYSLPYAVALLELGTSIPRAQAVVGVVLDNQDTRGDSATRGLFRWHPSPDAPHTRTATYQVAPMLARLHQRHRASLGTGASQGVREAMELAARALQRNLGNTPDDEALLAHAALAQLGAALGEPGHGTAAVGAVRRWLDLSARMGRLWSPAPGADVQRLLALQHIWEAVPEDARGVVESALRLCYLDFSQRVHPTLPGLAGAAQVAFTDDLPGAAGPAAYLMYRDFDLDPLAEVRPGAVPLALARYRPPADMVALPRPDFEPYTVETHSAGENLTHHTATYMSPRFTLGTMTGWVMRDTLPVVATFSRHAGNPSAVFYARGGVARASSLQYSNMAICSFNFDRVGVDPVRQVWLEGRLGMAGEVQEVYCRGEKWTGEPAALGARETVVVRRGGAYLAVTLLESGVAGEDESFRRRPGVLEWKGIGEHASLTLSIYGRHEEYALPRPLNDVRAGFVIQVWEEEQFPSTLDCARWLETSRITQSYATGVMRTPVPQETHGVLDRRKPQPRTRTTTRSQRLHTVEYAYQRGRGSTFELVEDLRNEEVVSRSLNGELLDEGFWWRGPAFTWELDTPLATAFDPPPAPEEKPATLPAPADAEPEPAPEAE